ncbi:MAG: hypothetical protein JW888_17285 [Pirellulales bacterium]|nr:hypothetical protein [Pirellulales bacterium]
MKNKKSTPVTCDQYQYAEIYKTTSSGQTVAGTHTAIHQHILRV